MAHSAHYAAVPDPRCEGVLAVDGALPCFEAELLQLADVLEGLAPLIGEPPYLRLAAREGNCRLHVFDTGEGESVPFEEVEVPPALRPAYEQWVAELRGAPLPELRSAWARPGWLAEARAWAGLPLQPVRMWSLSAVLRSGDTWFKAVFPLFHHEPAITEALAREHPHAVPPVLRVDHERGWMLMRGIGSAEPHDDAVRTLGQIQREWCDRTGELKALGAPDRSLDVLEAQVAGLVHDLAPELAHAVPALEAACRIEFPMTLVHGDLNHGNVSGGVIFDWSDACVAHPLFDLHLYALGEPNEAELVAAYSEGWGDDVRDALELARPPSCLHQAASYRAIQAASEETFWFEGAGRSWIERAVESLT
jgi:hypothetical protein